MTATTDTQKEPNEKEINFRKQEEMYKRQLEQEKQARLAAEERATKAEQARAKTPTDDDDDASDDPYVDHKVLTKKLAKFEKNMDGRIEEKAKEMAGKMLEQRDKEEYFGQHADFNEVMSPENLQKFYEKHTTLAKNLARLPDGFDKQKLVYENMKALKVGQKEEKSDIQEKIDQNRRGGFYQPSGMGSPPHSAQSDFSPAGQKAAFEKVKALRNNLRI